MDQRILRTIRIDVLFHRILTELGMKYSSFEDAIRREARKGNLPHNWNPVLLKWTPVLLETIIEVVNRLFYPRTADAYYHTSNMYVEISRFAHTRMKKCKANQCGKLIGYDNHTALVQYPDVNPILFSGYFKAPRYICDECCRKNVAIRYTEDMNPVSITFEAFVMVRHMFWTYIGYHVRDTLPTSELFAYTDDTSDTTSCDKMGQAIYPIPMSCVQC